jgi:hypothetical protein
MLKQKSLAAITLLCLSSAAWSQSTQPEADKIKAALETYLGNTPGVVSVMPKGSAYELKLDINPFLKKVPELSGEISQFIYALTPMADGKWDIAYDAPFSLKLKTPMGETHSYAADRVIDKSTFDSVNKVTLNSDVQITNFTNQSDVVDATTGMSSKSNMKLASIIGTTKGTVVSPGVADIIQQFSATGGSHDISTSGMAAAGVPPFQLVITTEKEAYTSDLKSARTSGILSLVAWAVAHPEKQLVVRDQQNLKDVIRTALPLWDQFKSDASFEGVKVASGIGLFNLQKLGMSSNFSGLSKASNFQFATTVQGLTIPKGLLPTWADELAPTDMKLDVAVSGWDAETGVAHVLDKIDLQKEPPLSDEEWKIAATKFASNPIKITINPSQLGNGISTISYSGEFKYVGEKTSGEVTVTQTGFDALFEKVQAAAASDPSATQVAQGLIGAKGLGKPDGKGGYTWVITVSEDGKVLVNGIDVTKLSASP